MSSQSDKVRILSVPIHRLTGGNKYLLVPKQYIFQCQTCRLIVPKAVSVEAVTDSFHIRGSQISNSDWPKATQSVSQLAFESKFFEAQDKPFLLFLFKNMFIYF